MTSNVETKNHVRKLTLIDHQLQHFLEQEQSLRSEIFEIDNALSELKTSPKAYKIVGSIMVASDATTLTKELLEKKELLSLRKKTISDEQEKLKTQAKELRSQVTSEE